MPPSPRIKVCGVTSVADAQMIASLSVNWIGLNFHPASQRCISTKRAADIVASLPTTCEAVGLFVDRDPAEIKQVAEAVGFNIVQLHGEESAEAIAALRDLRVIKALRIGTTADIDHGLKLLNRCQTLEATPYAWLFDARDPARAGGTGRSIDDELIAQISDSAATFGRIILAGGLTPENVADRVRTLHPWMVDVASGVESSPGHKDAERVRQFVENTRQSPHAD